MKRIALFAIVLLLASAPVRAWEVGVINTWIRGKRPLGGWATAHGGSLVVREEVWKYADIDIRAGYMRSDCFKTYYVPIEAAAALKYPLWDERLVPFAGIGGGYHIYTSGKLDLRNNPSVFPIVGLDWRWGKRKQWALFIEGRYEFMATKIESGANAGDTANFTGPGASWGIFYRF